MRGEETPMLRCFYRHDAVDRGSEDCPGAVVLKYDVV